MFLIVGLGNPGAKYQNNRHNVGHIFIDYLVKELTSSPTFAEASVGKRINELKLVKTDCFMNQSGNFVKKLIRNLKLEIRNLLVVHDDLDIPLGKFKIQKGVGPRLHNGLESIEQVLGTKDFWRVRIGVDNRPQKKQMTHLQCGRLKDKTMNKLLEWIDGETYVLQDFTPEEKEILKEIFPKILHRLKIFFNFVSS